MLPESSFPLMESPGFPNSYFSITMWPICSLFLAECKLSRHLQMYLLPCPRTQPGRLLLCYSTAIQWVILQDQVVSVRLLPAPPFSLMTKLPVDYIVSIPSPMINSHSKHFWWSRWSCSCCTLQECWRNTLPDWTHRAQFSAERRLQMNCLE